VIHKDGIDIMHEPQSPLKDPNPIQAGAPTTSVTQNPRANGAEGIISDNWITK
jgi:hypothetical protein